MLGRIGEPCFRDHTTDEHYAELYPDDVRVLVSIKQVERITRRLLGNSYREADVMPTKVMVAMMLMLDRQEQGREGPR